MTIRKECDDLWAEVVKKRAGYKCERCGSKKKVSSHHLIPRTKWRLRYDLENGIALCYYHHISGKDAAHKNALEFREWVKDKRDVDYLLRMANVQTKNDYQAIKIYLKQQL